MEPRVVYVLAGCKTSVYSHMACVSATMTRVLHPELELCLVCDEAAWRHLRATDPAVLDPFDTAITVPDVGSAGQLTSRYLKTLVRLYLDGDLLYLDADTLPIRPFLSLRDYPGDVLAAHDRIPQRPNPHIPVWCAPVFHQLGWVYPPRRYVNCGVLYWRDTPASRALAQEWHRRWRASVDVGYPMDQPAFNAAANELQVEVGILPVAYNAMVVASPRFARGAKILHFYATMSRERLPPYTLLDHLVAHRRATGVVDMAAIERARRRNYPWMVTEGIKRNVQTGHYMDAVRLAARRGVREVQALIGRPGRQAIVGDVDELEPTLPAT